MSNIYKKNNHVEITHFHSGMINPKSHPLGFLYDLKDNTKILFIQFLLHFIILLIYTDILFVKKIKLLIFKVFKSFYYIYI